MANLNLNTQSGGGIFSLLAICASAVFFAGAVFGFALGDVQEIAAGLFCLPIAWGLSRIGL